MTYKSEWHNPWGKDNPIMEGAHTLCPTVSKEKKRPKDLENTDYYLILQYD